MSEFLENDIKELFKNLCCSRCKNDFSSDSVTIKEKYDKIFICNLRCIKCEKDFGDIVFSVGNKQKRIMPLEVLDGPPPIGIDEVIDAHRFIKNNL